MSHDEIENAIRFYEKILRSLPDGRFPVCILVVQSDPQAEGFIPAFPGITESDCMTVIKSIAHKTLFSKPLITKTK